MISNSALCESACVSSSLCVCFSRVPLQSDLQVALERAQRVPELEADCEGLRSKLRDSEQRLWAAEEAAASWQSRLEDETAALQAAHEQYAALKATLSESNQ